MEDVFVYPLKNSNEYNEIINTICNKEGSLQLNGLLDMQKPHITYSIFKELARSYFVYCKQWFGGKEGLQWTLFLY